MSQEQLANARAVRTSRAGEVHRWRAFAVLAVAFFMTIVDLTIVNVALPTIGEKLHFSEANLQWVVTSYGITFGGFLLLGGRAADLLGRRRVLMIGLATFTAASLGCALATSDSFLIGMRGLQGIGAAIVLPAALSIVMNMFEEGPERNKALGVWGGIGAGGATVGLIAGGLLTRYAGWEYIFYLNVPVGAAALLLAPRIVPESRLETARRRYDPFGALAVTGGLLLLVYTISKAPEVGWGATRTVTLLAVSAASLLAFLFIETRVEAPLLPLGIFRLRTLSGANAVGLLLGGSFFGFIFVGTLYMQQVLGYSALQTGLAWLAASVTSVALAGLSQALVTRGSAKLVMALGMALIGGGVLWATQVPVDGRFWHDLAGPFLIAGAGTAFAFIPVSIAGLAGVSEREAGLASGLLNTSQQLGGAIGVAIASTVAATHLNDLLADGAPRDAALTGGFQWAFWVSGALALLALPAIAILRRRSPDGAGREAARTGTRRRERVNTAPLASRSNGPRRTARLPVHRELSVSPATPLSRGAMDFDAGADHQ
jgi:EmrB/QacA subfamily drug resistance transporter